jgi:nucleotide-binding universal stress UspA family protein
VGAPAADPLILCGIDPSDEAATAAGFAANLAVRLDARLILLHAAPQPWISPHSADYPERLVAQEAFDRVGYLGTVVEPIRVDPATLVERRVEFGRPDEVLRSVAKELDVTHLVVGSRGQGAIEEVLAASTSGALVRDAPCPVILVPSEPAPWSGDSAEATIICGVDGSDGSLTAAQQAGELARRLNAQLVLATVIVTLGDESPDAQVEEIRAGAPGVRIDFQTLSGVAADELLALARRRGARLVVAGSRGRGVLRAAVLGSVSGRLVQETDRPVMVVPSRP